jgi:hypothetical protein
MSTHPDTILLYGKEIAMRLRDLVYKTIEIYLDTLKGEDITWLPTWIQWLEKDFQMTSILAELAKCVHTPNTPTIKDLTARALFEYVSNKIPIMKDTYYVKQGLDRKYYIYPVTETS